ncbi:hypothetical protein DFH06DRAFT_91605 [Mycena polygramma]|nr:hypothetical protein DFH06DRAFT_91605 [Mycena polygramma]
MLSIVSSPRRRVLGDFSWTRRRGSRLRSPTSWWMGWRASPWRVLGCSRLAVRIYRRETSENDKWRTTAHCGIPDGLPGPSPGADTFARPLDILKVNHLHPPRRCTAAVGGEKGARSKDRCAGFRPPSCTNLRHARRRHSDIWMMQLLWRAADVRPRWLVLRPLRVKRDGCRIVYRLSLRPRAARLSTPKRLAQSRWADLNVSDGGRAVCAGVGDGNNADGERDAPGRISA